MAKKRKMNIKSNLYAPNFSPTMNRDTCIAPMIISLMVLDLCVYLFLKGNAAITYASNFIGIFLALSAFVMAFIVYKKLDESFISEKRTFLLIALAFLSRLIGEMLWTYYEFAQRVTPAISGADIFWYLSYGFVIVAFAFDIKKTFIFDKARIIFISLAVSTLVAGLVVIDGIRETHGAELSMIVEHWILLIYVLFDIYVIGLISVLAIPMISAFNKTFRSYVLIAAGFLLFALFDFFFAKMHISGSYATGNPIDVLYDYAYLLIFSGLLVKYLFIKGGSR